MIQVIVMEVVEHRQRRDNWKKWDKMVNFKKLQTSTIRRFSVKMLIVSTGRGQFLQHIK